MSSASEAKHTLDWLKWLVVVALVAASASENLPAAHSKQLLSELLAAVPEYLPRAQSLQVCRLVAAGEVEYFPAAHAWHSPSVTFLCSSVKLVYVPAAQAVHVSPSLE